MIYPSFLSSYLPSPNSRDRLLYEARVCLTLVDFSRVFTQVIIRYLLLYATLIIYHNIFTLFEYHTFFVKIIEGVLTCNSLNHSNSPKKITVTMDK